MKLKELDDRRSGKHAKRALKEHFDINLDLSSMSKLHAKSMLVKVRNLLSETRFSTKIHNSHQDPAYVKLLMLETALVRHVKEMSSMRSSPIQVITENEEVQKSQVILAAQDLIDSLQKMLGQVSKINIEELPAVVEGINNEIGSSEGSQYSEKVGAALTSLQEALSSTKKECEMALGIITGESKQMPDMKEPEEALPDMDSLGTEEPSDEEEIETIDIGRERR